MNDGRDSQHSTTEAAIGGLRYLRELTTDALRYWELRRFFYNFILAVIVLGHFLAAWPASKSNITFNGALGLFLLVVLANIAFSMVYIADVFIQLSGFRDSRPRWRWLFLATGFAFAAILTHFWSSAMFLWLNPD